MKKYFATSAILFFFSMMLVTSLEARGWGGKRSIESLQNPSHVTVTTSVPTNEIITDPEGDDLNFDSKKRVDVISIEAGTNGVDMSVRVNFSSATIMSTVVGYVDLDTDQNKTTGVEASGNIFVPGTNQDLGVDYQLDFFMLPNTGNVEVRNPITWDVLGTFPATVEGQSITVTIPLSVVGNDDGYIYVGAALGNIDMATDAAPNDGHGFLLGPGRVFISPSSSIMAASQNFDLTFLVYPGRNKITQIQILLNGSNITQSVLAATIVGTIPDGESFTARIPQINAEDHLGMVNHTLTVTIHTEAGVFSDTALYTVIPNCETCRR